MRTLVSSLLLLSLLFVGGCHHHGGCVDPDEDPQPQTVGKVLFEVNYTNFAWGYAHRGMYIDNTGRIYTYEWPMNGPNCKNDTGSAFTEAQLMEHFAPGSRFIGTVSSDTLAMMRSLMADASRGYFSDTTMTAADAGGTESRLYLYDASTKIYRPTALRLRGDYSFDNLSPSATLLADILEKRWQEILLKG